MFAIKLTDTIIMKSSEIKACIELCYQCANACDACTTNTLKEKEVIAMTKCIELNIYCAEVCRLAASLVSKGELFMPEICGFCAKVCNACADECARHQNEHCLESAFFCRQCAEACSKLTAHAAS